MTSQGARRCVRARYDADMKAHLVIVACAGLLAACAPDTPRDEAGGATPTPAASPPSTAPPSSLASSPPSSPARISQYTRLDACRVIERSAPGGGDYSTSACPGLAGYGVKLTEDDLRQSLIIRPPGGGEQGLALSEATRSGGFSRLGETLEWRGEGAGAAFRPDAMILRYLVVENPDRPRQETSYLLTVSLGGAKPCVTGKLAPGSDQNQRARRAADEPGRCLI